MTTARTLVGAVALFASLCTASAPLSAQAPSPDPVPRGVLTMLTVNPGVARPDLQEVSLAEVRHTLELYLDGKILPWYGRGDGRGVVFVLKGATVEDAKAITDTLPLAKAGFVSFEYVPLSASSPAHAAGGAHRCAEALTSRRPQPHSPTCPARARRRAGCRAS